MAKLRYGMVIDINRCIGCHACVAACKAENGVSLGVWRTQVRYYEKGKYPYVRRYFLPLLCDQCEDPPCVRSSASGAFYRREDGIVLIDIKKARREEGIYEKYAIESCPIEAIFTDPMTGMPDKCNFCVHRVDKGLVPACVTTCIGRARIFGDLNDPNSEISRYIATHPTRNLVQMQPNKPGVFYVGLEQGLELAIKGFRQIDPQDFEGPLSMS